MTTRPRIRRAPALLAAVALAGPLLGAAPGAAAAPAARGTDVACPAPRVPVGPFGDVAETDVFATAIDCLRIRGTINGTSPTSFAPGATVTRGQAAVLLARVLAGAGVELPAGEGRFTDLGTVTPATRDAVESLAVLGVVGGKTPTTYAPLDPVQRDQSAALLLRTLEALDQEVPPAADCFDDTSGNVHAQRIAQACAAGLVQGLGERRFDGGRVLTRAQLAGVLARLVDVLVEDGGLPALPPVEFEAEPVAVDAARLGSSWRPGCPVAPAELVLLRLTHVGFDGRPRTGELVVARDVAEEVSGVFGTMYAEQFPVRRMVTVDRFGSDDDASMAFDNTSAFNCRQVTGGTRFSEHSYGTAIDVNPRENPYVTSSRVLPPEGREYLDRSDVRPGMVVEGDVVVRSFDALGWGWGGRYRSLKDYQHFSESGR